MYKSINDLRLIDRLHANGWSQTEDELLLSNAATARTNRRPLIAAFRETADMTGRKPNSVRNHYYQLAKHDPALLLRPANAVMHFSEEQLENLMREMLIGISNGESVRGCALRLGGGDMKLMLRYQNKYRSTIQKEKAFVQRIIAQLKEEGHAISDPGSRFTGNAEKYKNILQVLKMISALSKDQISDLLARIEECADAE